MATYDIVFNPNPVQKQFIESRARADLFSSRMGEGKSTALCWAIFHHTINNPGAEWAMIRDTWENLRATTQKEFFKWFPPGICGEYKSSLKEYKWKLEGMGGGTVSFLGMDDPKDASKLQSRPLAGFAIDEPAPAAESGGVAEEIFDVGLARLRQPGMKWYCSKLAQNNPDENHWSYRRFVSPGNKDFVAWQTLTPENTQNLPAGYYENLRNLWAHRPDFVRRFVEGKYGFTQVGEPVTPQWSDDLHLTNGLAPVPGVGLDLLWDFGLNPTCIITQVTPLGYWNVIEALVGDGIGVLELIANVVKPVLAKRYDGYGWRHIGDPAGKNREQSSSMSSAVTVIKKELGGVFLPGPVSLSEGVHPLGWVLSQTISGRGMVQVDREKAKEVWLALRGGWHYNVARTGIVSTQPVKNEHSHPGDAMRYGAGILFPRGRLKRVGGQYTEARSSRPSYFDGGSRSGLGFEKPGQKVPKEARVIHG